MAIALLVGVAFQGEISWMEIEDAIKRGVVPSTPLKQHAERTHDKEKQVQNFLREQGLPVSSIYQSVFVCESDCSIPRRIIENYGLAFVVKPQLLSEIAVASLGDMQNAVANTPADGRNRLAKEQFAKLQGCDDIEGVLLKLVARAIEHNCQPRLNKRYVEARIYRHMMNNDLLRPCMASDFVIRAPPSSTFLGKEFEGRRQYGAPL